MVTCHNCGRQDFPGGDGVLKCMCGYATLDPIRARGMENVMVVDKGAETREHIHQVQLRMERVAEDIQQRALNHDASKLEEPELSGFYEMNAISKRSDVTYGSPEYKALMASQKPVIAHHYEHNDHHPEHWKFHEPFSKMDNYLEEDVAKSGELISSMTLPAIQEMMCDWDAAAMRYKDGSFAASFDSNCERFGISPQLKSIMLNTALYYGFVTREQFLSMVE